MDYQCNVGFYLSSRTSHKRLILYYVEFLAAEIDRSNNLVLFDGDIMLTKAQRRSILIDDGSYYSVFEGGRWTDGIIPYVIIDSTNTENEPNYRFRDFNEKQLEVIMAGINTFNALPTCVKFVEREAHHEYYTKIINELEYNSTTGIWKERGCSSGLGRSYYAKHGRNPHPDPDDDPDHDHQKINLAAYCLRTHWNGMGWDGIGT